MMNVMYIDNAHRRSRGQAPSSRLEGPEELDTHPRRRMRVIDAAGSADSLTEAHTVSCRTRQQDRVLRRLNPRE
jgi:hypothetical protein